MLFILLILTPETATPTVLLRRARRLRKLTKNPKLRSQSEIDQKNINVSELLVTTLVRPLEIMIKDPSILFVNFYTAYFYGTFYTYFEVFPLVFLPFYGFNLGETGLVFLANLIGSTIGFLAYLAYLYWYMIPDNLKNGFREQEHRLIPTIYGSLFLPVGLFMFGWTADSNIHWIVPIIGVVIFAIGGFLVVQGLFMYVPMSYPQYAASLLTSNAIVRSSVAAGCILEARPMFINLGVHKGVTVLAGLSIMGVIGSFVNYIFGKQARSKFAQG